MIPKIEYQDNTKLQQEFMDHENFEESCKLNSQAAKLERDEQTEIAIEIYKRSLELLPGTPPTLDSLAGCYDVLGDVEKAKEYIFKTLEIDPGHVMALSRLVDLSDFNEKEIQGMIYGLTNLLNNNFTSSEVASIHRSIARLYKKIGDIEREFQFLDVANKVHWTEIQNGGYDYIKYLQRMDFIMNLEKASHTLNDLTKPVFIVGMPRSGTTLIDQILTCHDDVDSLGESAHLAKLAKQMLSHNLEESDENFQIEALHYVDYLDHRFPEAKMVINKMPGNYWHIHLIKKLFPKAKIIFCVRDPIATCFSCWKSGVGGEKGWKYFKNMKELGKFYNQIFIPLKDYWLKTYDDIHVVKYEDVVENFDETIHEACRYLDIDFQDSMRNFHESNRAVHTISRQQVRKPLYKTSLEDWKKYEKYLDPLKQGLMTTRIKRDCGSCHACCVISDINSPELVKEAGISCPKLDLNTSCNKCTIYEKRPQACANFECMWKDGYGRDWDRPNKSGIVGMVRNFSNGHWIVAIETRKDAVRSSGRETLIELSRKFDTAVIIQLFDSEIRTGNQVVIKNSILHRATTMTGDFIEWLDTEETIGLYKLPNQ